MAFGAFEVHAGAFEKGKVHQLVRHRLVMKVPGRMFRDRIALSQIDELEVASEESVNKLGGAIGLGIAGDLLFGPIGLLAGLLRGGRRNQVTFICRFKDGRKFLATAPMSIFSEMRTSFATSQFGRASKAAGATNVAAAASSNFDRQKWNALLLYDKDIALAAEKIRPLNSKWMDELASAYLVLNDKNYLPDIVEGIVRRARIEGQQQEEQKVRAAAQINTGLGGDERTKIRCRVCDKQIQETADTCPYCKAIRPGTGRLALMASMYAFLAGVGGSGMVFQGDISAGLLLILSAVVAFPPSGRFVERRFNIALPGWLRAIVAIALLLIPGHIWAQGTRATSPAPASTRVETPE